MCREKEATMSKKAIALAISLALVLAPALSACSDKDDYGGKEPAAGVLDIEDESGETGQADGRQAGEDPADADPDDTDTDDEDTDDADADDEELAELIKEYGLDDDTE